MDSTSYDDSSAAVLLTMKHWCESFENGTTRSKGTDESFSTHNALLIVFALEIRLLTMDSTPYDDSSVAVLLTMNEQGCQKKPAAGENRTYLVSIGRPLCLAFLYGRHFIKKNIPRLAAYFDNSAIYFKTF